MKITDFALVFIGITLPIIIVVYINVSYTIKAQEQELYYQRLVDSAIHDATIKMKEVENEYKDIDYGYSGVWNKKISVNAKIGVDTFFNSLYNNLGIKGNSASESYLQLFVPAIAIVDYNGVQISSIESFDEKATDGNTVKAMRHALKPKRYYSFTYALVKDNGNIAIKDDLVYIEAHKNVASDLTSIHTVEFTMDDYISHRGEYLLAGEYIDIPLTGFYLGDDLNNDILIEAGGLTSDQIAFKSTIIDYLRNKRKEIIAQTVINEMSYAINKNNAYASSAGVSYTFTFPQSTKEEWYKNVEGVGIIAFMQGLSVGNKYLNYKAYGSTNLTQTEKYYLSNYTNDSKIKMNLYHKTQYCAEYRVSLKTKSPEFANSRQQAASISAIINKGFTDETITGFSPCPICNP